MEAFKNAGPRLVVHLSFLFNSFLSHGYAPKLFCHSIIIPLVKSKSRDLNDVNNYRAICISTAASKILESLLFKCVQSTCESDNYQFGFKHSTSICTNVLKSTVDYYARRGSHVFACFVDFSKAFDNVNFWQLFCKLLDCGVRRKAVALIALWYSSQDCVVKWQNTMSEAICIINGVRQGGILSPYLFTFYIRDLLKKLVNTRIGCNIGGIFFNVLAYADDMVLLAPSWSGLQHLLHALNCAATDVSMTFNTKKTVCMVFDPSNRDKIIANKFPALTFYLFISILQQHLQHLQFIKFNYFQSMMLKGAGRSQHLCLSTRS